MDGYGIFHNDKYTGYIISILIFAICIFSLLGEPLQDMRTARGNQLNDPNEPPVSHKHTVGGSETDRSQGQTANGL